MASTDCTDPVSVLRRANTLTRTHLRALATAAVEAGNGPSDAGQRAAIAWLDGPAQTQRRILETQVFPALIESMAGSDAVCLRDLTTSLARERGELDRCWRATIRPRFTAEGSPDADLPAWAEAFDAYLRRIDDELLPMVPRLFDDEALDALARDTALRAMSTLLP
jgi:hypothetical protein